MHTSTSITQAPSTLEHPTVRASNLGPSLRALRTPADFVSEGSGAASLPVRLADAAAPMAWDASLSTHRETPLSTQRETPLSRQRDTPRSSQRGSPAPVPAHAESHALPLTETRSRSRDAPVFEPNCKSETRAPVPELPYTGPRATEVVRSILRESTAERSGNDESHSGPLGSALAPVTLT